MSKKANAIITLISLLFLAGLAITAGKLLLRQLQAQPLLIWLIAGSMLLLLVLIIFLRCKARRSNRNIERELQHIDAMEGWQFEGYMAALLQRHGYADVCVTQQSGDYGADITASLGDELVGFQCKRSQQNVGVQGVKDISAGMQYYGCTKGIVITNQYFTRQARELAEKCCIELWDRDTLWQILEGKKPF